MNRERSRRPVREQAAGRWVLGALLLSALPSLFHLPWWVSLVALSGAVLGLADHWRRSRYGKAAAILLLGITAAAIWLSFESWFGGDAVLSFFIAVVFLKWSESSSRRDYLLLLFAAVILAAVGALYWESLFSLLHLFVVVLALVSGMVAITSGPDAGTGTVLRQAGGQFLLALPLMAFLFITFPRIPGPLWDIGLAFGLPVRALMERGEGDAGRLKVLSPGMVHRFNQQENDTVLVAEFQGAVPFKSRLYWRGPVYWDFDGQNWRLPEGWDNRARLLRDAIRNRNQLERELRWKRQPVRYSLRVMPNGGRWLYGLDVPAAPAPESFISADFQLLSIRRVDDHEPRLEMLSYLEYGIGSVLTDGQRARALAWPEGSNPRLLSLGRQLRRDYPDPEELLHQALARLATGGYTFDPGYVLEAGDDQLDRFFFDHKRGGVEYLAGSFAMLLRAAGVPARLVGGFRGGTIVALTNFVIVKQTNAHVWVEVWREGRGWSRVEPKDIVVSPDQPKRAPAPEGKEQEQLVRARSAAQQAQPAPASGAGGATETAAGSPPQWLQQLAGLFDGLEKWVVDYDPDRQMDLLREVGIEQSDWGDLLTGALAGTGLLALLYLLGAGLLARRRADPVTASWRRFCDRMAKLGIVKDSTECPRDYLRRIVESNSEYASAAEDITSRYLDIRYGGETSDQAVALLRRQVKRFLSMT